MSRTIFFVVAAAVAGTLSMAPAAQACISCEHVPVVVRDSLTYDANPRYYARPRFRAPVGVGVRTKVQPRAFVVDQAAAKRRSISAARSQAKAVAVPAKAEVQTLAIAQPTAPAAPPLPVAKPVEKVETVAAVTTPVSQSETVSLREAEATPTDCKRFVPSAGLTISVPCQ